MKRSRLFPRITAVVATAALTLIGVTPAQATMPVIDVAALAQLIQTIMYWENQLSQMQAHLNQLRQTTTALTGLRGMQSLLPITPQERNYLPTDWTGVSSLTSGGPAGYGALANLVAANLQGVSVVPPATLAALTPDQRKLLTDGRNSAALLQALSQTAYASTSARFQQLQTLIQAIGTATDEKAINDLQGRIQSEQSMLANDQAKLTALYQAAQADKWSQEQRMREMSITQLGSPQTLRAVAY
jgi:type IV secretion system protein VirB5